MPRVLCNLYRCPGFSDALSTPKVLFRRISWELVLSTGEISLIRWESLSYTYNKRLYSSRKSYIAVKSLKRGDFSTVYLTHYYIREITLERKVYRWMKLFLTKIFPSDKSIFCMHIIFFVQIPLEEITLNAQSLLFHAVGKRRDRTETLLLTSYLSAIWQASYCWVNAPRH